VRRDCTPRRAERLLARPVSAIFFGASYRADAGEVAADSKEIGNRSLSDCSGCDAIALFRHAWQSANPARHAALCASGACFVLKKSSTASR
jgi:hypothetical protein